MVDKISQSMLTLAENNKEFKTALRFMLKCEIQLLLTRLSEIGDESLLIIANKSEESASHFGSGAGESYLQACSTSLNFSIKDTFLKHCLEGQGQMLNSSQSSLSGQGQMLNNSMNSATGQGQMNNSMTTVTGQGQMMNNNMNLMSGQGQMMNTVNPLLGQGNMSKMLLKAAYMTNMGCQSQGGMTNRQVMGAATNFNVSMREQLQQANRFSPYQQQTIKTKGTPSSQKSSSTKPTGGQANKDLQLNRAVCRHFAKGNCWQGNMCAFLHVHQDPDSVSEDTESTHEQSLVTTTETSSNDNVIK